MKYLVFIFLISLAGSVNAQYNILSASGNQRKFLPVSVDATGSSLFFVWQVDIAAAREKSLITLEKISLAGQDLATKLIAGDTAQSDSLILPFNTRVILDSGYLYIVYTKAFQANVIPANLSNNTAIYFQKLDTNLNVIVPEKMLYSSSLQQLYKQAQVRDLTLLGQKLICPYIMIGAGSGSNPFLSKAIILDRQGTILVNDTIPMKQSAIASASPRVSAAYSLNDRTALFTGFNLLHNTASVFDFVTTDTLLNQLDTFRQKPVQIQELPVINNGFFGSGFQLSVLPTGSLIGVGEISYTNASVPSGATHTAMIKLKAGSRYRIDTAILFAGKDAADSYHAGSNGYHTSCFNNAESRVYYANTAHSSAITIGSCDGYNYLQICSADTNLHQQWRKFLYSDQGYCFQPSAVTSCVGKAGIYVAGIRFSSSNPGDSTQRTGFIYQIDSSTTTAVGGQSPMIIRDRISVYPNPATRVIYVEDIFNRLASIDLINFQGQVVGRIKISGTRVEIPCSIYPPGVYSIRVTTLDNEIETKKILIK